MDRLVNGNRRSDDIGWTHDGGATWETTPELWKTDGFLSGLAFADQSAGMLTMDENLEKIRGRMYL